MNDLDLRYLVDTDDTSSQQVVHLTRLSRAFRHERSWLPCVKLSMLEAMIHDQVARLSNYSIAMHGEQAPR